MKMKSIDLQQKKPCQDLLQKKTQTVMLQKYVMHRSKQIPTLTHTVALHRSCLPNLRRWSSTVECKSWVVRQHNFQGHQWRPLPIAANSSRCSSFSSRALHLSGCPSACRCRPPPSMESSVRSGQISNTPIPEQSPSHLSVKTSKPPCKTARLGLNPALKKHADFSCQYPHCYLTRVITSSLQYCTADVRPTFQWQDINM